MTPTVPASRRRVRTAAVVLATAGALGLTACGGGGDPLASSSSSADDAGGSGEIVVGSADFSESILLAHIYAGALEADGAQVARDAFGHVQLDEVNPGERLASTLAQRVGADKSKVWKSGYFARSAAPNAEDLELIARCTALAVDAALDGRSGVVLSPVM